MEDKELQEKLAERLKSLPKVVRDAITSADVEAHLRTLANTHKLHLDQWQLLENEVMLTLLGFQEPADFKQNIKDDLVLTEDVAVALAGDISKIVFDPIRAELERSLEHPDAQAVEVSDMQAMGAQVLASSENGVEINRENNPPVAAAPPAPPVPIAPLPTAPDAKAIRAPISEVYKPGVASTERKDVASDPYRESPK